MNEPLSKEPTAKGGRDVSRTVRRWLRRAAVILGCVLAGFVLGAYVAARMLAPAAQHVVVNHDMNVLRVGLESFRRDFGRYPDDRIVPPGAAEALGTDEVLAYSLGRALPLGDANTAGPFVIFEEKRLCDLDGDGYREFLDPWGNPYQYTCLGNGATYVIVSRGRDGKLGGTMAPGAGYRPSGPYGAGPGEADNVICYGPPPVAPAEPSAAPPESDGE